ncbi:MAG: UvrD-helicase domain-containing protein [Bacteroidota bacterium]
MINDLNDKQKKAVIHDLGPCMVIAGPGAGKTRIISRRVAYLIQERDISIHQILVLTFTKKAALEMRARIEQELQATLDRLWIGTFHSVFSRILRIEGKQMGIDNHFVVYAEEESKNLIKTIVKELNLDPQKYVPNKILNRVGAAKKSLVNAKAYAEDDNWMQEDRYRRLPEIATIYQHYEQRCQASQALDFDDILFYTYRLFQENPQILSKYQERFRYVLVDEFQDTNEVQYAILRQLVASSHNLFIVGDDAQSIYAFQGANISNMLEFPKLFPEAQIIKLEQNYRSTKRIIQAANQLIKNNKQHAKHLFTENHEGDPIHIVPCLNDLDEARFVAHDIFTQRQRHQLAYTDFAILYRTNRQSKPIEDALRKLNIPYQVIGGISFYQRKEVKDLLAYLRLVVNPNDEQALLRTINLPKRGIGPTTLNKLKKYALDQQKSYWSALREAPQWVGGTVAQKIVSFVNVIEEARQQLVCDPPHAIALQVAQKTGLLTMLREEELADQQKGLVSPKRQENIEALFSSIQAFYEEQPEENTLAAFLQDIALLLQEEEENDMAKVSLITAHRAKGLEWPALYITGMIEEVFPSWRMLHSPQDIEEERRLAFVAITRAKKRLTITYTKNRFVNGQLMRSMPSRFLSELDPSCLEIAQLPVNNALSSSQYTRKYVEKQRSHLSTTSLPKDKTSLRSLRSSRSPQRPIPPLTLHMEVKHPTFGKGRITKMATEGPYPKVEVNFTLGGNKTLLLQYAQLEPC